MTRTLILVVAILFPLMAICQTQAEIDAKKQRVQDAMKANPEKAAEYQKMLDDLNNMKPGEARPSNPSRSAPPASRESAAGGARDGSTSGGVRGGKSVQVDGITYTNDSLPGPLYVTLEWLTDPSGKKPSKANLDGTDTKAIKAVIGEEKSKSLQTKLANATSANDALSLLGTLRFYMKHQTSDNTSDGWQRTSYLLERIVPVKF